MLHDLLSVHVHKRHGYGVTGSIGDLYGQLIPHRVGVYVPADFFLYVANGSFCIMMGVYRHLLCIVVSGECVSPCRQIVCICKPEQLVLPLRERAFPRLNTIALVFSPSVL